jgi:hypothetical protein
MRALGLLRNAELLASYDIFTNLSPRKGLCPHPTNRQQKTAVPGGFEEDEWKAPAGRHHLTWRLTPGTCIACLVAMACAASSQLVFSIPVKLSSGKPDVGPNRRGTRCWRCLHDPLDAEPSRKETLTAHGLAAFQAATLGRQDVVGALQKDFVYSVAALG